MRVGPYEGGHCPPFLLSFQQANVGMESGESVSDSPEVSGVSNHKVLNVQAGRVNAHQKDGQLGGVAA